MRWSLDRKATVGLGAALVLLLVIGAASYWTLTVLLRAAEQRQHSQEVLLVQDQLRSSLNEVEAGGRNYILNGDEASLKEYQQALGKADEHLQELRRLTGDSPEDRRRFGELESVLAGWLDYARRVVDERAKGRPEAIRKITATGEGRRLRDRLHNLLAALEREEHQRLDARAGAVQSGARVSGWVTVASSLLTLALFGGAVVLLNRHATARARAQGELRQAHDALERRVRERTEELAATNEALRANEEHLEHSLGRLRELSAYLHTVREEERKAVAREIHDELGQQLTGLKIDLAWLKGQLARGEAGAGWEGLLNKTVEMTGLVDATIQTVRRIATELRPGVLDDLGLVAALEWQAQEFQKRSGIPCTFTSALEEVDLSADRTITLFRIAQEALTNVARHAGASEVRIDLKRAGETLILEVTDNGRGFAESASPGGRSFGLLGMRERAMLAGGECRVVGTPGRGTQVTATVPVDPAGHVLT